MGAVFVSSARAPITAVIIIFELTGDHQVILPLMFAIVVATALSNALTRDTIYTLKLRRRGIDLDAPRRASPMSHVTVGEAMGKPPRSLRPEQPPRRRWRVDRVAHPPSFAARLPRTAKQRSGSGR